MEPARSGVRIEPQTPDHAAGLFAALSDPRLYAHLDEGPPASVSQLRARLELLAAGGPPDGSELWYNWTVFDAAAIVGYVQATLIGDTASIACVLTPTVWGRGVAGEACRQMLAALLRDTAPVRFVADAARDNDRSRRLLARLGFALTHETVTDAFYAVAAADVAASLTVRRDSL